MGGCQHCLQASVCPFSKPVVIQEALSEKQPSEELATERRLDSISCTWQKKKKKSRQERGQDSPVPSGGRWQEERYTDETEGHLMKFFG